MAVVIGSARVDENGRYRDGRPGDQKQISNSDDRAGEVSQQTFYVASKGWNILRLKNKNSRGKLGNAMVIACNNKNIGYSQSGRYGVIKSGIDTKTPTNSDCSSLVRACIKYAIGTDVGDFNTSNEASVLERSGLFLPRQKFISLEKTPLYTGDVLVTCSKGHTVIVVRGQIEKDEYYPVYHGTSLSIVQALKTVGEKDSSFAHRTRIAEANGIKGYQGTASQNSQLVTLIKNGKLKRAA